MRTRNERIRHDLSVRYIRGPAATGLGQAVYQPMYNANRFLVKKDPNLSRMSYRSLVVRSLSPVTVQAGSKISYGNFYVKRDRNLHDPYILRRVARV